MKNGKYSNRTPLKKWKQQKNKKWYNQKDRKDKIGKARYGFTKPNASSRSKLTIGSARWRLPGILFLIGMFLIILVLPSLIVAPFVSDNQHQASNIEKGIEEDEDPYAGETAVSVAVMRAQSEQVENVPLEKYVAGVVASEMPVKDFELEALKAQALAARTFIVDHLLHTNNTEEYVSDTVEHQVYKNEAELRKQWGNDYNANMEKLEEAVAATKGEILTYKNAPIFPAFFSTSNGYTENSEDYWENELPYLRSVKSPWDKDSSKYLDQITLTMQTVEEALNIDLPAGTPLAIEATRTEGQRVDQVKLGEETFTGRDVREKLNLRSSDFTIEQKNNHLIFTTKGFGHGVGMSQFGANGMAKEGKTYEEIVAYYYKDVEISTVTDTAPTLVAR